MSVPEISPEAAAKALVRRLVEEGVNLGDLAIIDQVLDPTFPSLFPGSAGPASVKQALLVYRGAIPDAHWTILEQVAEGELVVTSFVASGTQRGPLWGLPATGKRMAVGGMLVSRCRGERIVEQRLQLDLMGLLQQLGVMPELGLDEEVIVARLLWASQFWTNQGSQAGQKEQPRAEPNATCKVLDRKQGES